MEEGERDAEGLPEGDGDALGERVGNADAETVPDCVGVGVAESEDNEGDAAPEDVAELVAQAEVLPESVGSAAEPLALRVPAVVRVPRAPEAEACMLELPLSDTPADADTPVVRDTLVVGDVELDVVNLTTDPLGEVLADVEPDADGCCDRVRRGVKVPELVTLCDGDPVSDLDAVVEPPPREAEGVALDDSGTLAVALIVEETLADELSERGNEPLRVPRLEADSEKTEGEGVDERTALEEIESVLVTDTVRLTDAERVDDTESDAVRLSEVLAVGVREVLEHADVVMVAETVTLSVEDKDGEDVPELQRDGDIVGVREPVDDTELLRDDEELLLGIVDALGEAESDWEALNETDGVSNVVSDTVCVLDAQLVNTRDVDTLKETQADGVTEAHAHADDTAETDAAVAVAAAAVAVMSPVSVLLLKKLMLP